MNSNSKAMNTFNRSRLIWTNPWIFIACGFGIGTLPIMPGTYATIASALLCLLLAKLNLTFYIAVVALLNIAGVWLCGYANKAFGTDDHPAAVWDEIAAFPITLIAIPFTWYYLLIAIVLFRIFDILKPWPICWIDKNLHGGLGVMLDDILAALASWVVL
ncbi:MAG: phosphatidylglycerophosphatase A, partial [Coxiellaceae bacterium]|nr:phosphatidylglycerophosphatase A [Coxiellaceae bacterium]